MDEGCMVRLKNVGTAPVPTNLVKGANGARERLPQNLRGLNSGDGTQTSPSDENRGFQYIKRRFPTGVIFCIPRTVRILQTVRGFANASVGVTRNANPYFLAGESKVGGRPALCDRNSPSFLLFLFFVFVGPCTSAHSCRHALMRISYSARP